MRAKHVPTTVRRSVALPRHLVDGLSTLGSPELQQNFNRLVTVALQEFIARRKARAFDDQMAQMAADPAIQSECAAISRAFATVGS